jgi:hypothetical protein
MVHTVIGARWLPRTQSWRKMGPKGRAAALALPLGPEEAALVGAALAE